MTKFALFSEENIKKAKEAIAPLAAAFLKVEPGNTLVMPETKEGMRILEEAITKLEGMGYTSEDAQHLMSDVVEKLHAGIRAAASGNKSPRDDNF